MNVLVTGAAGYIGSHAVLHLLQAGHRVVALDNLCRGHRAAVQPGATFVQADVRDTARLIEVMTQHDVDAVLHFAALTLVPESVQEPIRYWRNIAGGAMSLLDAMGQVGVRRLVFSSTCATYGEPESMPIVETTAQRPINPYGQAKLAVERMLADVTVARPDFSWAALRYFNVAGCDGGGRLGEDHDPETHLLPILLQAALGQRDGVAIFGTDYPTPDGTCIRDYVHVDDLIDAHLLALETLSAGQGLKLNLGIGRGFSVREVIDAAHRVTGVHFHVREAERRPGDPPSLYADATLARETLGWAPRYVHIDDIIDTAWRWMQAHPAGYVDDGRTT